MITKEFVTPGHTTRFTITRDAQGWEVREERDNAIVKHANYADWHRVERALHSFELEQSRPDSTHES